MHLAPWRDAHSKAKCNGHRMKGKELCKASSHQLPLSELKWDNDAVLLILGGQFALRFHASLPTDVA